MAKDEGALRKKVEETQNKVVELRDKYAESAAKGKPNETIGKQLLKAREKASEALADLWDAVPNEKPPTQSVM